MHLIGILKRQSSEILYHIDKEWVVLVITVYLPQNNPTIFLYTHNIDIYEPHHWINYSFCHICMHPPKLNKTSVYKIGGSSSIRNSHGIRLNTWRHLSANFEFSIIIRIHLGQWMKWTFLYISYVTYFHTHSELIVSFCIVLHHLRPVFLHD